LLRQQAQLPARNQRQAGASQSFCQPPSAARGAKPDPVAASSSNGCRICQEMGQGGRSGGAARPAYRRATERTRNLPRSDREGASVGPAAPRAPGRLRPRPPAGHPGGSVGGGRDGLRSRGGAQPPLRGRRVGHPRLGEHDRRRDQSGRLRARAPRHSSPPRSSRRGRSVLAVRHSDYFGRPHGRRHGARARRRGDPPDGARGPVPQALASAGARDSQPPQTEPPACGDNRRPPADRDSARGPLRAERRSPPQHPAAGLPAEGRGVSRRLPLARRAADRRDRRRSAQIHCGCRRTEFATTCFTSRDSSCCATPKPM
jgi:hypothetical protein